MDNHNPHITLRAVRPADLPVFFDYQQDPIANEMAAFTAKDPTDWEAFLAHWEKIQADKTISLKTILFQDQVAGYLTCHSWFGDPEVSYWIGRNFWGQGIATQALNLFLAEVTTRPLFARAAKDNAASLRVLEKCGFEPYGKDQGFANARGREIEEIILRLV